MRADSSFFGASFLLFCKRGLVFVMLACLLTACESKRTIVNGIDQKEANEILVFLSANGINASKSQVVSESGGGTGKDIMWNIIVDESQGNEAMALLNQVGLPRRRGQNLLGIFSNGGLVPSGMQEKVRYQAGLAEQIASTIRKIDGVLDADVQISFPDEDPLNPGSTKKKITASVYVKHSGVLDDPNAHLVTRIKRLVAGSVNGLDYDNVQVISDRARFSDSPFGGYQGGLNEEDHPNVHVWSMIIAKESLFRFRLIFFSFTMIVFVLVSIVSWLIWKFFPILSAPGGLKKVVSLAPLKLHWDDESVDENGKRKGASSNEEHVDDQGIDENKQGGIS